MFQSANFRDRQPIRLHIAQDGVLYSKDMSRLIYSWQEKEYFSVPQSVKVIEPFAFCLQKRLRDIELHNDIVSIGDAAFMGC